MIYYLILVAVIVFYIIKNYMKSEKTLAGIVVVLRVGPLGSGKTFISVMNIIRDYKRLHKLYKLNPKKNRKPVVYSTIPIRLTRKLYANVLKREHILLQEKFEKDCIPLVLWDEVGMSCNQYSYDDENIITKNVNDNYRCAEVFIRYFRHMYDNGKNDCRMYLTDNSTGGICVNIRRRFTYVDVLERLAVNPILPFYKLYFKRKYMTDEKEEQLLTEKKICYYFGFLMPKDMSIKHYESTCYRDVFETGFLSKLPYDNWSACPGLRCCYVPDVRSTEEEKQQRKMSRQTVGRLRSS